MSEKISDMPIAVGWDQVDILTGVQGGVNVQMSRETMVSVASGEVLNFNTASGSQMQIADGAGILVTQNATDYFLIFNGAAGMEWGSDTSGNFFVTVSGAGIWQMVGDTCYILTDASGNMTITGQTSITISSSAGTVFVKYATTLAGAWASDPPDVWTALDRIAYSLAMLLGTPIPDVP